jgi:UDP-N-acetylmuramoylalanine--D-glutamate ligase
MQELVRKLIEGKKVIIAGFGREGRSTYRFLRNILPGYPLAVADISNDVKTDEILLSDDIVQVITGEDYLANLDSFDLIFKTPGIPTFSLPTELDRKKITSQTDLFLRLFSRQAIGITGTKGKSTTSSLVYHILETNSRPTVFAGNIGTPLLDVIPQIMPDTTIVMELSSHQLEYLSVSPHISVLLNIYQEHLDHYRNFEDYQNAKFNIGKYQGNGDFFLYNRDNELINKHLTACKNCNHTAIPFSLNAIPGNGIVIKSGKVLLQLYGNEKLIYDDSEGHNLKGDHNLLNIMAAAGACALAGVGETEITEAVRTFNGLEHRIEYVGKFHDIEFYNDSIATIPEASIEAVKTLQNVDTLILGGFDRGIDYNIIYPFLKTSAVRNLIFVGEAGKRMREEFEKISAAGKSIFAAQNYEEVVELAFTVTCQGKICLLSPAAASYDMFKNFEERGRIYKKLVREYKK